MSYGLVNAKDELVNKREGSGASILCAEIVYEYGYDEGDKKKFLLKKSHTSEEYERFMNSLDFHYDNGYGRQKLFGTVWLNDSTWLERGEYDGSEWWEHKKLPEIPEHLK